MSDNQSNYFWNGQLLEIVASNNEIFYTQLVKHDFALFIQRPVNDQNQRLTIDNGMAVKVYFYDEQKNLYSFESKIFQLPDKKVIIQRPPADSIKKTDRRRFFRVQVAVDMRLLFPSSIQSKDVEDITTLTYDLSGGGLSFLYPHKITEIGTIVKGILYLKMNSKLKNIEFSGRIVNVIKLQNQMYRISLQYIHITEATRSKIIRFCMFKQIELRNKVRGRLLD